MFDNYRPLATSPVVNAGYNVSVGEFDLDGHTRIVDTIDIGAFEFQAVE